MQRDLVAATNGALGGGVATAAMSGVMAVAYRSGLLGQPPPERMTGVMLDAVGGRRARRGTRQLVALLLHALFGMGCGVFFGLLRGRVRLPGSMALQGAAFGGAIWLVSYGGWAPTLGLMPPPDRDRPGRPIVMVLAHVVYGLTLGAVVGRREA